MIKKPVTYGSRPAHLSRHIALLIATASVLAGMVSIAPPPPQTNSVSWFPVTPLADCALPAKSGSAAQSEIVASQTWGVATQGLPDAAGFLGLMIQRVDITYSEAQCLSSTTELLDLPLDLDGRYVVSGTYERTFYEMWFVWTEQTAAAVQDDTFATPPLTAPGLSYEKVGTAKFIPAAAYLSDPAFQPEQDLSAVAGPLTPSTEFPLPEGSGEFRHTDNPPAHPDHAEESNWDNNYGGSAIDVPGHFLAVYWLRCPPVNFIHYFSGVLL